MYKYRNNICYFTATYITALASLLLDKNTYEKHEATFLALFFTLTFYLSFSFCRMHEKRENDEKLRGLNTLPPLLSLLSHCLKADAMLILMAKAYYVYEKAGLMQCNLSFRLCVSSSHCIHSVVNFCRFSHLLSLFQFHKKSVRV